jgi:hypothetical protein
MTMQVFEEAMAVPASHGLTLQISLRRCSIY